MRAPGEMTGTGFMVIPPPEWMKMARVDGKGKKSAVM
jgi:hypothetical protein